jgi:hypothetical protein
VVVFTASEAPVDTRIPSYLGRILTDDGRAAGTCFQVRPRLLITAYHVLAMMGQAAEGCVVRVDPLGGGESTTAIVERLDASHDLAVLVCGHSLSPESVWLTPSDGVGRSAPTWIIGVAHVEDRSEYRYLEAPGRWAGSTVRTDPNGGTGTKLARLQSTDVMLGMSGAPVLRMFGSSAIGMVSGRYNAIDGWLEHTVWVIRVEDILAVCAGVEFPGSDPLPPEQPGQPGEPGQGRIPTLPVFLPVPPGAPSSWLTRDLVTNGQFHRFLVATGRSDARREPTCPEPDLPVVDVSITDAQEYLAWLERRLCPAPDSTLRLPTVGELWTAAAAGREPDQRVGELGQPDQQPEELREPRWLVEELKAGRVNFEGMPGCPTEVGAFGVNPYGLTDLMGNVHELCSDGAGRYVRYGGAYNTPRGRLTEVSDVRSPEERRADTGFRCAFDAIPHG